MILEFSNGSPLMINGKPLVQNVVANVPAGERWMKIKMNCITNDEQIIPVYLVITSYTTPKLDKLSTISIQIAGKEMERNIPFNLKLSYNFIKKIWHIEGRIGFTAVSKEAENIKALYDTIIPLVTK